MGGPPRRHPHRGLTLALALASAPLLACPEATPEAAQERASPSSSASPLARGQAPEPALHGCHVYVAPEGWRCLMSEAGTVSLWLPGQSPGSVNVLFDGAAVPSRELVDRDGLMIRVELPSTRGELQLAASEGAQWSWSIELAPLASAYTELLDRVAALASEGDLAGARSLLRAAKDGLPPDEAALSRCLAARLAYAVGDLDQVLEIIEQLADTHAAGCRGAAHLLATHALIYDAPDFNGAARHIEAALGVQGHDFETEINAVYQRGVLDHRVGQIDESLDAFERAARLAGLVDERELVGSARIMQAVALARLARFDEAGSLARAVEAQLSDSDDHSVVRDIRYDLAWIALLRREHDVDAPDPSPALERLLDELSTRGDAPQLMAGVRLHLALAAMQGGAPARARAHLDQVEREHLDPIELVWLELIASQAALAGGGLAEAARRLDRAQLLTELNEDRELAWRVFAARATFERARGRDEAALVAYSSAGALADQLALSVPGSAGRSMVVTSHSRVDAEHIELLLDAGRPQDALCVAAGVRARHLRSLWARLRRSPDTDLTREYQELLSRYEQRQQAREAQLEQAWSLTTTELAQLRDHLAGEGERADELLERATALLERSAPQWSCEQILPKATDAALLTMAADSEHRRWHFMLARGSGLATNVTIVSLDGDRPPVELARQALAQLATELAGAETLTVVPIAAFVNVDFHRLTLEQPQLAKLTLSYSLGLRGAGEAGPVSSAPLRAAVVAGADDLDAVTREVAIVAEQLRGLAWSVDPRWSPRAEQPTLLHYSGHGHHAGVAGWSSYIELPELGRVSAAQIVAAQRAPRLVVLGACSAGSSNEAIIDGGMNLAAAFLLAGAELVIAPSGAVDDEAALALASGLYSTLTVPDSELLIAALTARQRAELAQPSTELGPSSALRWRAWTP